MIGEGKERKKNRFLDVDQGRDLPRVDDIARPWIHKGRADFQKNACRIYAKFSLHSCIIHFVFEL